MIASTCVATTTAHFSNSMKHFNEVCIIPLFNKSCLQHGLVYQTIQRAVSVDAPHACCPSGSDAPAALYNEAIPFLRQAPIRPPRHTSHHPHQIRARIIEECEVRALHAYAFPAHGSRYMRVLRLQGCCNMLVRHWMKQLAFPSRVHQQAKLRQQHAIDTALRHTPEPFVPL